jgi:hypothetical protein
LTDVVARLQFSVRCLFRHYLFLVLFVFLFARVCARVSVARRSYFRVVPAARAIWSTMASLGELERQARELRRRAREIEEKCLELKRKALPCPGPAAATPWVRAVALAVLALTDRDFAAAVEYVRWKGRGADEADVVAWCRAVPDADWQSLLHPPSGSQSSRQLREARKFLDERKVVEWVKHQNEIKGIAPSPGVVLDEGAALAKPPGRRSSQYKWLRRVVGRWGGRKAVFSSGESLPAESLHRKAAR